MPARLAVLLRVRRALGRGRGRPGSTARRAQADPAPADALLYVHHLRPRGCDLFRAACAFDLEGIVAKCSRGSYQRDGVSTSWVKIKNPHYTQMRDRHELFASRQSAVNRDRALMRPAL